MTHNTKADQINRQALELLNNTSFKFTADIEDEFPENLYPIEPVLELKKDAQVMFIKNDISGQGKFFNGKIGVIESLTEDKIVV